MNKKLLASLMAGVMLISQGTSLSAAKPNQRRFWAETKSFAEGVLAGGLSVALAGTIAYLVHTCDAVVDVVNMDIKDFSKDDLRNKLYENLNKGKIVKYIINEKEYRNVLALMCEFVYSKYPDTKVNFNEFVRDHKRIMDAQNCFNFDVKVKLIKHSNNELELRVITEPIKCD